MWGRRGGPGPAGNGAPARTGTSPLASTSADHQLPRPAGPRHRQGGRPGPRAAAGAGPGHLGAGLPHAEEWRSYGVFPAAVPVPEDAPLQDRLLGSDRPPARPRVLSFTRASRSRRGRSDPGGVDRAAVPVLDQPASDRDRRRHQQLARAIGGEHRLAGEPAGLRRLLAVDGAPRCVVALRPEAEHQRRTGTATAGCRGRRTVADGDAGLLGDLAATAASSDSPGSTKPASVEIPALRPGRPRPSSSRSVVVDDGHDHRRVGARVVLAALPVQRRVQPACAGAVGAPQRGQCVWVACQFDSATASASRPADWSSSAAPTSRRVAQPSPGVRARTRTYDAGVVLAQVGGPGRLVGDGRLAQHEAGQAEARSTGARPSATSSTRVDGSPSRRASRSGSVRSSPRRCRTEWDRARSARGGPSPARVCTPPR